MSRSNARPQHAVMVEAPARLHLGFVDLAGDLGRRFGSVGLTLDGPASRLTLRAADIVAADGPDGERAARLLHRLHQAFGVAGGSVAEIAEAIPAHSGLGSGTQLALALGAAFSRLYRLDVTPREIAHVLKRGARSGIGIGAFEQGGFIVDGGRGRREAPPPTIARLPVPAQWRILLVFDRACSGLHGEREARAFGALPPFPPEAAQRLCRLLLMRALPALAEEDLGEFGAAIGELQRAIGDHFAPAQGGRYASARVASVLAEIEAAGVAGGVTGLGQSSWGPTGFALLGSETEAQALLRRLRTRFADLSPIRFEVCAARNRGADIQTLAAREARPERLTQST